MYLPAINAITTRPTSVWTPFGWRVCRLSRHTHLSAINQFLRNSSRGCEML